VKKYLLASVIVLAATAAQAQQDDPFKEMKKYRRAEGQPR
jgi:hypothetical protein